MKRILKLMMLTVLFSGLACAQQSGAMEQGSQQGQMPMGGMHGQNMQNMQQQHMQMMKGMQADVDTMRATLQKMKDQLAKVKDPQVKQTLQLNTSLWETLVSNLEKHISMLNSMMEMRQSGQGMMMGNPSRSPGKSPQQ